MITPKRELNRLGQLQEERKPAREYRVMSVMTIYVQAKSKAEINRRLEEGHTVVGTEYKLRDERRIPLGEAVPDGTVIKVFRKYDPFGTPYAQAYGRWNAKAGRVI
jgi:hypothetical protein